MRKIILTAAITAVIGAAAPSANAAFSPDRLNHAVSVLNDTIQVKRSSHKRRPPGWDRGRKAGWGRGHMPPGQRKH